MFIAPPCIMPAQSKSPEADASACVKGPITNWRITSSEAKYGDIDRRVITATILVLTAATSR
jgi:hypothetical protein